MSDLVNRMALQMRRIWNARRAMHYRACFCDEDGSLSVSGRYVLADLRNFCRANQSTFDPDSRIHALLEGRREAILRMVNFLEIDSAELNKLVEVQDE